jgi:hypothetical protein
MRRLGVSGGKARKEGGLSSHSGNGSKGPHKSFRELLREILVTKCVQ